MVHFKVMINIDFMFEEEEGKTINRKQFLSSPHNNYSTH